MDSKAQIHMRKLLKKIADIYKVELLTEVKEGSKKYDFYFPTSPPVVIEIDGQQHNLEKADGFFFKSTEQLLKYKKNDKEREMFHKMGKIYMLRFNDDEFPDICELLDMFEKNGIEKILSEGVDEENAYYKRIKYTKEQYRRRREQNKEFRKKFK